MQGAAWGPYVPARLADWLRDAPETPPAPREWRSYAAVLLVDITGFTALTERLDGEGPAGAEILAGIVNVTFGAVIDEVRATGGDVGGFAGDAVVGLWPADAAEPGPAIRAALRCGHAVQAAIGSAPAPEGVHVRARAGVAVGEIWTGTVGGVEGAWRYLVAGAPVVESGIAASRAQPDQVVATVDAAVAAAVSWEPVDERHALIEATALAGTGDSRGSAPPDVPPSLDSVGDATTRADASPPLLEDARLVPYLPRELVARIKAEPSGWLAEFRRVTAVFVAIADLDYTADDALEVVQSAVAAAQSAIEHYGGSLNTVVAEDKGTMIVAGWGLPDRTHEDDAVRAVQAARAIVEAQTALGLRAGAGVATGRAFCGLRGNAARREYAILGDVMNTAARLMQAAHGDVRTDAATARAVEARLPMEALATMAAKGKATALPVFRPLPAGPAATARTAQARPRPLRQELVGRDAEWAILAGRLDALRSTGRGGVVILEGEPGIGKSSVLGQLVRASGDIRCLLGESDAIEQATPYYVWRRPLLDLVEGQVLDAARLEAAVMALLADDPALAERAPLLDAILPLEMAQTARTASLESEVRADAVRDLVVHILARASREAPLVIVLDDAHWMDSSSWSLALSVSRRVPGVLLVLATRPMSDPIPFEYGRLLDEPGAVHVPLEPLGADAALTLVRGDLGADDLPPEVAAFITERAEGNPFFSVQLAFALREAGFLLIEGESARLAPGITSLAALDIPATVQGVITGRIDRLTPAEQLTLKVGSVIGRLFRFRILSDVHPLEADAERLKDHLDHSGRLDLTTLGAPEPDLAYLFKHVITQEVAYDLLVYAQRRPLHRAVAEWYERHAGDLEPHLPLLAHHWGRAEETDKALEYLERAAKQALGQHANIEALRSLDQALALDAAKGNPAGPERRARWERWAGIAMVKTSRYRQARDHFETSLRLRGSALPSGRVGLGLALGRELVVQIGQRLRMPRLPADRGGPALELSETYRHFTEVSYWANDLPAMVHAMLRTLNAAGPAGDSKELVGALTNIRFLLGLARLRTLGRFYKRLSDSTGARVGDPDADAYAVFIEAILGIVEADWERARADAERAAGLFKTIGDRMRWHTCFSLIGFAYLHQGWFDRARPYFEEGLRSIGPDGARQARIWSLGALLATELARGEVVAEHVDTLEGLLGPDVYLSDEIWVRGLVAQARLRAGEVEAAVGHARAALPLIEHFPPASWHTYLGTAKTAEVLLDRWRMDGGGASAWSRDARRAVSGLKRFARFNPDASPRAALLEGHGAALAGGVDAANRAWRRAARLAAKHNMPYDRALALAALAAAQPLDDPRRRRGLAEALLLLAPLGASDDEARVRRLAEG